MPAVALCLLARAVGCAGAWPGLGRGDLGVSSKLQPSPLCGRGGRVAPGEGGRQYVSELTKASIKPNEPKRLKTLVINEIAREAEKRTQARYQP